MKLVTARISPGSRGLLLKQAKQRAFLQRFAMIEIFGTLVLSLLRYERMWDIRASGREL
ncbi:hypothetical protein [Erwinia mallotivora]|uniref:hypothetical protein n=1 Tax=Erwinia mallotivora TaxID=69222 RepID=UPI00136313B3|nr:hypothetical protein [Erwinia mallotivora]